MPDNEKVLVLLKEKLKDLDNEIHLHECQIKVLQYDIENNNNFRNQLIKVINNLEGII